MSSENQHTSTETIEGFSEGEREEHFRRLRDRYFWAHLIADFASGICFVVGSVLFFFESFHAGASWLFLIGSLLFAAKPTIRLAHELARRRLRDALDELVDEMEEPFRHRSAPEREGR